VEGVNRKLHGRGDKEKALRFAKSRAGYGCTVSLPCQSAMEGMPMNKAEMDALLALLL